MESDLDDSMYLIPTIFISSPMVNEALFATVSGESCDITSSPANEEFPRSELFCRSSISPDFESDTESHEALYANLIEKRYEVEKLTEGNEWVSRKTSSHDYGINSFLNETNNKLYNIVFESTSSPEWATDVIDSSRRKSQPLVIKQTPYDSLDSLLSKIADSVLASNKQEGTLSAAITEELLPDERTYQKSSLPESDVAGNLEENSSAAEETFEAKGAEKEEDRFDENSTSTPMFFSPDDRSRPSSRDTSDRELLMVFEDLKNTSSGEKSKTSYGPVITKLLEANYYIKPEGSYHLPTNSLAFINNKKPTTDYNPYYAFLPEYSASGKIEINKHHLNIKNCVARDTFGGSKLIKSCEFSRKLYPQDPLRFLTYVKSNNIGGDSQLAPDIHYNPYYTFLPKFDKCVVNNVEARSSFEINTEIVKEVTHYESPSYETDESQDIARDGMGDAPPHDSGRVGSYRESKVDKMPVIVERQISCKQIEVKHDKRDSCTEVDSNELIQTTSEFTSVPRKMDYSTPVVAIFPEDLIPETSHYIHEPMVAVISHLFRDSIPEPIVQETLSNHSGDPESYYGSDDLCGFQVPVDLCNSAQLFVTEELGYAERSTEAVFRKESQSSVWKDIGWQTPKRLDDSDMSHLEDSSEELQMHLPNELKEAVWHSVESLGFHEEYCEVGAIESVSEKGTLEPPEDFANSREKSDPLVMSSLYEHPHRHQEIPPEMLSSMSSGALLRYQYVGCPLCSSSSTVIDDEDLELLLTRRFVSQTTTDDPDRRTRSSKSEAIPLPSHTEPPATPTKKVVTIARQLLHPQVDSLLATQGQRQRHDYESNCIGDGGFDDYMGFGSSPRRRGILANVRLAAGGPLYVQTPSSHRRRLERERSVSAGHGDGQGRVSCPIHIKAKRTTLPRSAPPTSRGEIELMKVARASLDELHLQVLASPGQYDAFPSSGKGDEISAVDQISRETECEKKKSECVLLDKDRMFIFSWETDSANEENPEINKRSYTLLHWTDSPYKSPPKEVLADLLKRVISGVSSYHLQSQSLGGVRPSGTVHRVQSLPKGRAKVTHSTSCSSKSLSQIEPRKSRKDLFNKYTPCETSDNDAKMRKTQNEDNSLYPKVSIPLCRKRHCDKLADKGGVAPKKRTVTFKEQKQESSESDGDPVLTKQAFTTEVTESELNMFLSCPILSESAIYSWWNLNRKVEEKNTQQMLLETSSNYSLSSTSSEDCDFISWR